MENSRIPCLVVSFRLPYQRPTIIDDHQVDFLCSVVNCYLELLMTRSWPEWLAAWSARRPSGAVQALRNTC
jgi:hypothetical protein